MAYRECPEHGWLETSEYTVTPSGETICPICEESVTGYYDDVRTRSKFGDIGGPTHTPRPKWVHAQMEFARRKDEIMDDPDRSYRDERPIMGDFELGDEYQGGINLPTI